MNSRLKKWLVVITLIIVGWTSYYDLSKGTLRLIESPSPQPASAATVTSTAVSEPKDVIKKVVQPGDTVLSIEERINKDKTFTITQVLNDFKMLNPSVDPNHIQIGHTYVFKRYH